MDSANPEMSIGPYRWLRADHGQPGHCHGTEDPGKEVKLGSYEVRFLIARSSPNEVEEVGLLIAALEKEAGLVPTTATAVRSPQSGLTSRNRAKWAKVANFAETKAGFSLQSRLHGGEGGILLG